jgi:hypothetical protein
VRVRYRRWFIVDDLGAAVDRFSAGAGGPRRIRWLLGAI